MRKPSREALQEAGQFDLKFTRSIWVCYEQPWQESDIKDIRFQLLEDALHDLSDRRCGMSIIKDHLKWISDDSIHPFSFRTCLAEARNRAEESCNNGIEKYEKYYRIDHVALREKTFEKVKRMFGIKLA